MKTGRDYGCEIMAVIILTVLSALSHFWYILIAIGVVAGLAGVGLLIATTLVRVGRRLVARILNPVPQQNSGSETAITVDVASSSRPSLPVA